MRRLIMALAVAAMVAAPSAASGQVSIMPKLGTPGVGADLAVGVGEWVVLRAGAATIPYEPGFTLGDIDWSVDFPVNVVGSFDLHPFGSRFRLSAGAFYLTDDLIFRGDFQGSVEIGDETWTESEVGRLRGVVIYDEVSPFVSLGFGRAAGRGAGMFLEVGAAFIGQPEVELSTEGGTRSDDPTFQAALAREEGQFEADIDDVTFYPLLNVGLRISF